MHKDAAFLILIIRLFDGNPDHIADGGAGIFDKAFGDCAFSIRRRHCAFTDVGNVDSAVAKRGQGDGKIRVIAYGLRILRIDSLHIRDFIHFLQCTKIIIVKAEG